MLSNDSKNNNRKTTNVRCDCGKIICQFEKSYLVVKCRHCKRLVILNLDTKEELFKAGTDSKEDE